MANAHTQLDLVSRLLALGAPNFEVVVDVLAMLQVKGTNVPLASTLSLLEECDATGAAVEVEVRHDEAQALLRPHSDGWSIDEDDAHAPIFEPKLRFTSAEILARATEGTVYCTFDKSDWPKPWTGWSIATFASWLENSGAFAAAEALFDRGPATIRLYTWTDSAIHTRFLTFGDLALQLDESSVPSWPVPEPEWLIRSALAYDDTLPDPARELFAYMSGASTFRLLAEDHARTEAGDIRIILDRNSAREFLLNKAGRWPQSLANSALYIISWVLEQPTRTRLLVAQKITAEDWVDLTNPINAQAWQAKAEVTFRAAVSEQVSAALRAQATFENHVLEFSIRSREAARALDKTIDDIVVRAASALLAVFITSVVAQDVRGWPVIVASTGVASYVVLSGIMGLTALWTDVRLLGELLTNSVLGRPSETTPQALMTARRQTQSLRMRIIIRGLILAVLVLLILAVGLALFFFVEPEAATP
jgi:hypothetical protein